MSTTTAIQSFIKRLAAYPSSAKLVNQYTRPECRQNLRVYLAALLSLPYRKHLLVGEAAGHRGCARTGIPFTDERMLNDGSHPFLVSIRPRVNVAGSSKEGTAGIVWTHLCECSRVPAFWNAVPFHPQSPDKKNRRPTVQEIQSCKEFLTGLIRIINPISVVAVGRMAESVLNKIDQSHKFVYHPSHGYKEQYIAGLKALKIGDSAGSL